MIKTNIHPEAFMCLTDESIAALRHACPEVTFREQEPLSAHTSFRIGGPAALMAFPPTVDALHKLLCAVKDFGVQVRVLGAGTNVLAPDDGLNELIICTKDALMGLRLLDGGRVEAMAGQSMASAAVFARTNALSGLEFAHGIPGTVGGGVYMNAGAYGGEIKQVIESVTVLTMDGEQHEFTGGEHFSYRGSVFQSIDCVIVSAVFRLTPADPGQIQMTMHELMQKRRISQPLELPSAGSTFKRPVGGYAAALIDAAGLKGRGVGGAQVSQKHAGFVVNTGGATARDVLATISMIQEEVFQSSGILLEPEVRIW